MNEELFQTLVPSTSFLTDPTFTKLLGRKCSLSYEYESEKIGFVTSEQMVFDGVESFRCTYYVACDVEMIEAYDRVVDLGVSQWLEDVTANLKSAKWNSDGLKHLRIFFDDGPCYEFLCRTFEVLRTERHLQST